MPPVKSAAIETPVTDPIVINTRLGGMVSVCAPVAANNATNSPGGVLRFISGNNAGAIAAISAALDPDIPDTKYIAPTST